ncbi:hypothetical protein [Roseomonas marmotae]|uniref:Uncharacterized protein n=1 Tax=Roseomonas marmotae TaxID=2768161 RepID=A0ABS3K9S0_9PROT|nr:hypothetical protein [Roseomonas marmotae]MBO1073383.1 hypothetical protein [Roseomonas marmotae]QTI80417.1 hypothetical protein IAI58_06660 [Roseomonas marmotae]
MADSCFPEDQQQRIDRSALLLMLGYIESECRAMGAKDAARHVAEALTLLSLTLDGSNFGNLSVTLDNS